jgi:hypothetical protein
VASHAGNIDAVVTKSYVSFGQVRMLLANDMMPPSSLRRKGQQWCRPFVSDV